MNLKTKITNMKQIKINSNELKTALNTVKDFADNNKLPLRPIFASVHFNITDNKLEMIATNTYYLAKYTIDMPCKENFCFTLSNLTVKELLKSLPKKDTDIVIILKKRKGDKFQNVFFTCNKITTNYQLLENMLSGYITPTKYPDYNAIIRKKSSKKLIVNREKFLEKLNILLPFTEKSQRNLIKINIEPLTQELWLDSINNNGDTKIEQLPCKYKGEKIEIGFNCNYLIKIVSKIKAENIEIKLQENNKAIYILPVSTEKILFLLMPLMIN